MGDYSVPSEIVTVFAWAMGRGIWNMIAGFIIYTWNNLNRFQFLLQSSSGWHCNIRISSTQQLCKSKSKSWESRNLSREPGNPKNLAELMFGTSLRDDAKCCDHFKDQFKCCWSEGKVPATQLADLCCVSCVLCNVYLVWIGMHYFEKVRSKTNTNTALCSGSYEQLKNFNYLFLGS